MDNKCFAIVALPLVLSDQIKETPLFVQLINEENDKNLLKETFDIKPPIFQTTRSSTIFSVKCSKQKPLNLALRLITQMDFNKICRHGNCGGS